MTDILERLRLMHYRLAAESEDQAANRRVQTAKDAAEEIKKLRAALKEFNAAYTDWFDFAGQIKNDSNEETKACYRLIAAQKVATSLTEKEQTNDE